MPPYSRPRQPPASRGSKLGYYRASIACVGCRKSKTRCLLTPRREQDSCVNCHRKNQPCAFLTVDKKPPDWIWDSRSRSGPKRRRQQQQTTTAESESEESGSSSSSQLSASASPTGLDMGDRDGARRDNAETQPTQYPIQQHDLSWVGDLDVDERSFPFETLLPPSLEGHPDPESCWFDSSAEYFVSPDHMGISDADLLLPQYAYGGPGLTPEWTSDINIMPLEYPSSWYTQDPLPNDNPQPIFDPGALTLSTPYDIHGHYFQVSDEGT